MNDQWNGPINKFYKRPTPDHSDLHPIGNADKSIDEEGTSKGNFERETKENRNIQEQLPIALGPSYQHEIFMNKHRKNHLNYVAFMESMGVLLLCLKITAEFIKY